MRSRAPLPARVRWRPGLLTLLVVWAAQSHGQALVEGGRVDADPPDNVQRAAEAAACGEASGFAMPACPESSQQRVRTAALLFGSVGATAAYGRAKWWQDGLSGRFKTVNEGWFGAGTEYGGADKLGHAMFAYTGARLLTRAYEWAGNSGDTALKLGLWTSVGTLLGVEVIDGYSKKWRFSKEDAVANLAGGAMAWWLETSPAADALLDLRLQYSRSQGPEGRRDFDPFGDYSGQRYLLVFKASGVPALRAHGVLRYLELNVGYGTRNFDKESRGLVAPTRHVYYGVSLNLTELLRASVFEGNAKPSRAQRLSETFFEHVQVPAASVGGERVIR
ncbi:MAG: YfiM family protein [Rhizobacter sp.]|nr:YfiM family protein [Rhizobacter sp.]